MKRIVVFVTGARADYNLMVPVLKGIESSDKLRLQIYATSNHLMTEFGYTFDLVKKEFKNTKPINAVFKNDDRIGMASFLGIFLSKFVSILNKHRPDIALIPCDRIEAFAAALGCTYVGIPICHVHGGERTFTVDEPVRHAISKLAHIHFTATKDASKRIERMGEEKWRIHQVGAPALDTILHEKLPDRKTLFKQLGIPFSAEKFILVTQHPVSEEFYQAGVQMQETLQAVKSFHMPTIIIYPHADAGGRRVIKVIEKERKTPLFYIFPNIPHKQFLSLEREAAIWVGNSSAGIIESASFRVPVVNIGVRQLGRTQSGNVINVGCKAKEIKTAIHKSLNNLSYRKKLAKISNIWGDGHASERIVKVLNNLDINQRLVQKQITY